MHIAPLRSAQLVVLVYLALSIKMCYSLICIDNMHCFFVLSIKRAVLLVGDDARFCMCRITVGSPLLLTTRYGVSPLC
jgi:hypothetical protein